MEANRHTQPITRSAVDDLLHVVRQLNLRYLRGLVASGEALPVSSSIIVTEHVLERVSAYPILLADVYFCEVGWWREAAVQRGIAVPSLDARVLATFEVIMGAWRCARPGALYQLSFGVAPAVCELMHTLSAHDIARIAYQARPGVVPRWSSDASFWGDLLRAAASGDAHDWRVIHLHGLQLLGRDLTHART